MRSIKALLDIYNTSVELEVNELIEIEGGPGIMDLTIEKVGPDRLSVAHYYIQNGDPKRDPEVVFDTSGDEWTPVEFREDPRVHQIDEDGIEMSDYLTAWNKNIQNQGFLDAARYEQGDIN